MLKSNRGGNWHELAVELLLPVAAEMAEKGWSSGCGLASLLIGGPLSEVSSVRPFLVAVYESRVAASRPLIAALSPKHVARHNIGCRSVSAGLPRQCCPKTSETSWRSPHNNIGAPARSHQHIFDNSSRMMIEGVHAEFYPLLRDKL